MHAEDKLKWEKILVLAPVFFLFSFGESLSEIVGNVLLVKRIGSELLPYTYLLSALLSASLAALIASLLKRWSPARVLQAFAFLGSAVFAGNFFLILQDFEWAYFSFLVIGSSFFLILLGTVVWIIANNICSFFESKKIFAYYSLAVSAGGLLTGLITYLVSEIPLEYSILLVCGSLVLAGFFLSFVQKTFVQEFQVQKAQEVLSGWDALVKSFQQFRQSGLAKTLFVVLTLFNITWWVSDYEYQLIVSQRFNEQDYSQLSGAMVMINSVLILLMLFVVQGYFIRKQGVLNTLLASPVIVLVAYIALLVNPVPEVALAVNVITPLIGSSTLTGSVRFVYSAVPHAIRNSVLPFISGQADAIATFLAGTGLILLTSLLSNGWVIGMGCALLITNVFIIVLLKHEYVRQVVHNLEGSDPGDRDGAIENLAEPAYHTVGVQELMKMLTWRHLEPEVVRKILFSLGKIDNINVLPNLIEMLPQYDASVKYSILETIHSFTNLKDRLKDYPFTQLNLIEAYEKVFLEEQDTELKTFMLGHLRDLDQERAINFLRTALKDPNLEVCEKAITSMRYFSDRGIALYLKPFLKHKNPRLRAAAIVSLWQFKEFRPLITVQLTQIMAARSKEERLAALFLIGKLRFTWESAYVKKAVSDSDPAIKTAAILAWLEMGDEASIPFVVSELTQKTQDSLLFARTLKSIEPEFKWKILSAVRQQGEGAARTCSEILKSTYANFLDEIEFLAVE